MRGISVIIVASLLLAVAEAKKGVATIRIRRLRSPVEEAEVFAPGNKDNTSKADVSQAVDPSAVKEIQKDLEQLVAAKDNLDTLITQMKSVLDGNSDETNSKYSQGHSKGTNYYGVPGFVKFYKNTYGYSGYPRPSGYPCSGVPQVNTLPTFPILIRRITADSNYLSDVFHRGYGYAPARSESYPHGQSPDYYHE